MAVELELYVFLTVVARATDYAEIGAVEAGVNELILGLDLLRSILATGLPESERVFVRWLLAIQEFRDEYRMTVH
jgi:hypothetical protein